MLEGMALILGYWLIVVAEIFGISLLGLITLNIWDKFKSQLKLNRQWLKFISLYRSELEYFMKHGERMPKESLNE